ncbi:flagellin [Halovibrio salipaludis]|uniref:Flagellin n=1 Tax=Halovibrio salipaludis TaxID=2032626 RepID=A0A2A2F6C0_9GAMM|nr:flagellin [Halovibrio salipaludis]PAU80189.1 flagellin [Halovibrio salipaludis]
MALGINTNVASINAQNQLSKSQGQNDQALERLSSGLRINSAKDDAAGLAISTRFESQIGGLNVASRNANDGISLSQTAEGALDEITNNLQRIRDLSVQAANATNSESDRQALNDEVTQRIEEIDRISSETSFNGLNVLDGSLETQDFQVGANVGETIGVDLSQGTKADQVGSIASDSLTVGAAIDDTSSQSLEINGVNIQNSSNFEDGAQKGADSAFAVGAAIEAADIEGLNVQTSTEKTGTLDLTGTDAFNTNNELTVNGTTVLTSSDGNETTGDVVDAINSASGTTGVTASLAEGNNGTTQSGDITLAAEDGRDIQLGGDDNGGTALDITFDSDTINTSTDQTYKGDVSLSSEEAVDLKSSDGAVNTIFTDAGSSTTTLGTDTGEVAVNDNEALEDADISSVTGANDAIFRADAALNSVNELRSELGAVQNRFESTISNLDSNIENLEASNSRIKDADFAAESAKLSQSQVLQQAGISVLSQANQRPQQVLSLLQ